MDVILQASDTPNKNHTTYDEAALKSAIDRFNKQMELSGGKLTYDGNGKIVRCKWSNVELPPEQNVGFSSKGF